MPAVSNRPIAAVRALVLFLCFAGTLFLRCRGISEHFWLLGDQIRDWGIVLGPLRSLPLVGPATHVHGYTIGPGFYWILWGIRVVLGPWYENLPHAGGIGQAILQSLGDTLLLLAVWRRTTSVWLALATTVLVATAAFDLALSAIVWNPCMGSSLAKIATALILMDFHRASIARATVTAAVAWLSVQAYTGAVFVALSVLAALLVDPWFRRDRRTLRRNAAVIAVTVTVLQVPYVAYQILHRFQEPAMEAVTGSVARVLSGQEAPRFAASVAGYRDAVTNILVAPAIAPWAPWALLACGGIVAIRYRRDPVLLTVTLAPQIAAIAGYAFFLSGLDSYYYLSLMPAAALTVVLGLASLARGALARPVGIALFAGALLLVPARLAHAATMARMPEYRVLVSASRTLAHGVDRPLRAVRTQFPLPPSSDPEFLYNIFGGRIVRGAPWMAIITLDGQIIYRPVQAP